VAIGLNDTFTQADIDAGVVSYDHDGSQNLADSFEFTLSDGGEDGAGTAAGTFNFTMTNVNDAPIIAKPNLLINGNFSTGDLTGWATTGTAGVGVSELRFGGGNAPSPHSATQTFTTTAGEEYTLTFQYRDVRAGSSQTMQIQVNGSVNLLQETIVSSVGGTSYVTYNYTFVADSSSTALTFTDISPNSVANDGYIDSVSITENVHFNSIGEEDSNNSGQTIATLIGDFSGDLISHP